MSRILLSRNRVDLIGTSAAFVLICLLLLTACGNNNTATPTPLPDLPRERLLTLSNRDGWSDLYTVDFTGKTVNRLTETPAAEFGAVWSPDGKRVAFTELNGDQPAGDYNRNRRLVVIDADGKNRRVVSQDGLRPAWSPDGSRLLFLRVAPGGTGSGGNSSLAGNSGAVSGFAPLNEATPEEVSQVQPITPTTTGSPNRTATAQSATRTVASSPTPANRNGSVVVNPIAPSTPNVIQLPDEGNPNNSQVQGTPVFPNPAGSPPVVPTLNPNLPAGTLAPVNPLLPAATVTTGLPDLPDVSEPTPNPLLPQRGGSNALYIVEVDKVQPVLLVNEAVSGVWSPDGKRVVYIGGNNLLDQRRTLNLINADGSGKLSLTDRAGLAELDIVHVSWSPDGTNIGFTATGVNGNKTSLYRLSPDATGTTALRKLVDYSGSGREIMSLLWAYADFYNPSPRLNLGGAWSPNSRYLAFSDGSAQLTVVDASNGSARYFPVASAALGQDKDAVLSLGWLPDNRRVYYNRTPVGRTALVSQAGSYVYDYFEETLETVDTANKNIATLFRSEGGAILPVCCGIDPFGTANTTTSPAASPSPASGGTIVAGAEGKLVYVSGFGLRRLIIHDLKTGNRKIISSGLFKQIDFMLSPDGKSLAYIEVGERFNATLYLTDLEGSNRRKISEGNGNPDELGLIATFSPDNSQLAFQALGADPNLKPGLYTLPLTGGTAAPKLISDKNINAFAWSPTSKELVFRVPGFSYEIYLAAADASTAPRVLVGVGRFDQRYGSLGRGIAWSPDGKYIATSGAGNTSYNAVWTLYLITPQGKVEEFQGYFISRLIGFTPDSSRLVATMASSNQRTSLQAFIVPGNKNLPTGWRSYDLGSGPLTAPDSSGLAYFNRAYSNVSQPPGVGGNPPEGIGRMITLNFANGVTRPLTMDFVPFYTYKARFFAWQPDSKALAFYENNTIYITATAGAQSKREVLARAFAVDHLAWVAG